MNKDTYWDIRKFVKNSPIYYNSGFFNGITLDNFIKKYFTPEGWKRLSRFVYPYNRRVFISKSAIRVADKVKDHLGLELMPVVIPVARKGYDMSGGTYPFMMFDKKGETWCFDIPVHLVLKKSTKLIFSGISPFETVISGEKVRENEEQS